MILPEPDSMQYEISHTNLKVCFICPSVREKELWVQMNFHENDIINDHNLEKQFSIYPINTYLNQ